MFPSPAPRRAVPRRPRRPRARARGPSMSRHRVRASVRARGGVRVQHMAPPWPRRSARRARRDRLRGVDFPARVVVRAEFFLASGTCPRVLPGGSARTPRTEAQSVGIRMSIFVLVLENFHRTSTRRRPLEPPNAPSRDGRGIHLAFDPLRRARAASALAVAHR